MKTCFVIMPYGGDDEDIRKHFTGVYNSIIAPAARLLGYEPRRSDIAGEPGNITADIIQSLAEAEIVVADLTAANANVFFELGIRHALRKSGTVHIVDGDHEIPFDVRQYRAIKYTTDLASLQETIEAVAEAMRKREQQQNKSDNPVHDALPSLPRNIQDIGEESLRRQLQDLQRQASDLGREKDELERRLSEARPLEAESSLSDSKTEEEILETANQVMRNTGQFAILRLTESAEKGPDQFAKELQGVMKSPYLSLSDFLQIARLSAVKGLHAYRLAALEIARKRFGPAEDILLALADAYDNSETPAMWEKGRTIVEEYLCITHTDGKPSLSGRPKGDYQDALGILFNIYFKTRRQDWVLIVASDWEKLMGPDVMALRNAARALKETGRIKEAEAYLKRAIEIDPGDDGTHVLYADLLDDLGRNEESYDEHVRAIVCDPEDGTRFANLAIHIINRGFFKDLSGKLIGPVPRKRRHAFAMPLFLHALTDRLRRSLVRDRVIGVLLRADCIQEAKAIAEGQRPAGDFDSTVLDAVLSQIEQQPAEELGDADAEEEKTDSSNNGTEPIR